MRALAGLGRRGRRALEVELLERGHPRGAGHAFLAAHRLDAEGLIEDVQIVGHRVAAPAVDDADRHASAIEALLVERPDVVGRLDRLGGETGSRDGFAVGFGGWRHPTLDELEVFDGRMDLAGRRDGHRNEGARRERDRR